MAPTTRTKPFEKPAARNVPVACISLPPCLISAWRADAKSLGLARATQKGTTTPSTNLGYLNSGTCFSARGTGHEKAPADGRDAPDGHGPGRTGGRRPASDAAAGPRAGGGHPYLA